MKYLGNLRTQFKKRDESKHRKAVMELTISTYYVWKHAINFISCDHANPATIDNLISITCRNCTSHSCVYHFGNVWYNQFWKKSKSAFHIRKKLSICHGYSLTSLNALIHNLFVPKIISTKLTVYAATYLAFWVDIYKLNFPPIQEKKNQ